MDSQPNDDVVSPQSRAASALNHMRALHRRKIQTRPAVQRGAFAAFAGLVAVGLLATLPADPAPAQTSIVAIKIDGVDELTPARAMAADFDKVLRNASSAQYIVINPDNGPEALDGNDPFGGGYAPPNPNVEDFVLRAKRLTGTGRVLGWLPAGVGAGRATDYRDGYSTDGVMLADYDCASATTATATIKAAWPTAVVVTATAGCAGGISAASIVSAAGLGAGSQDPYAGYPASPAPKLGIPAYFTDSAAWDRLLVGIADVGAVVVDWSSVGTLRSKIQAARAGGAKVYAYVPTGYITSSAGLANASNAATRISAALADPDINGVFLDEVRSGYSTRARTYYGAFYNQAVAAGKELIYNPGQTAGSGFLSISSKTINYEGKFATYSGWPASEWARTIPSDRIWQVIHTTGTADITTAANLAKSRNAGLVWIAPNDQFTSFPDAAYYQAVRTAVRGAVATSGAPVVSASGSGGASSGAAATPAAPAALVFAPIVDATTTTVAPTTVPAALVAAPIAPASAPTLPVITTTTAAPEAPPTTKPLPVITTTTTPSAAAPVTPAAAPNTAADTATTATPAKAAKAKYRLVRKRSCRTIKVRLRSGRYTTRRQCRYVYRRVLVRRK
jgi:Spherulation-specific family 4